MGRLVTNYFVPTSELIKERLEIYSISQKELAIRLNVSEKHISELLNNKVLLTMDMAMALEKVINIKYEVLMGYEIKYRGFLEKEKELEKLKKENLDEICQKYQIDFMRKKKWLDLPERSSKSEKVYELLKFFGVKNMENILSVYSSRVYEYSFKEDGYQIEPLLVWIRKCELEARKQNVEEYNKENFEKAILEIKSLIKKDDVDIFKKIKEICNENGVYFVMEEAVPNSKVRGAFTWIGENPLIQISLRYCSNDHFWFAFFHEVGHLMLHAKKSKNFIDTEDTEDKEMELEADNYSRNMILDDNIYKDFVEENNYTKERIIKFAKENDIHPGIVVGRLQHDGKLGWNMMGELKQRYRWVN